MKVLVLAPHVDDGEFGCGGSIAKFLDEGSEVYYAAFSLCEDSLPEGFSRETLKKELMEATQILGINPKNLIVFDYPVRYHPKNRQAILEDLVKLKKKLDPDVVFVPTSTDIHQDHHTIYQESLRAFKNTTILGYEFLWNNFSVKINAFICLDEEHVRKKTDAINKYKSQKGRHYVDDDFMGNLARIRGAQINCKYAEAFEVIRWIIKKI